MSEAFETELDKEINKLRVEVDIANIKSRLLGNKRRLLEIERDRQRIAKIVEDDEMKIMELEATI
jgi:hypothetical protein